MAIAPVVGTRTSLAYNGTDLSALTSTSYVRNTTAYDCSTNDPVDVIVEVNATPGSSTTGNRQVVVFIQESLDGTNYRTGPSSGTTATRESNLKFLGVIPLTTSGTMETGFFSVGSTLGFIPKSFYIVIKNDCGVTLSAGTVWTSEITVP